LSSDVQVEGDSGRVAAASGAILRLEVKARGSCGHCVGAGRKARCRGEFRPAASDSTLLKGGDGTQWRGAEESNGVWRAKRGRGGRSRKWLRRSTSGPDRWARAAALPRDSGGRRDAGDTGARG
jgi:hypothetical protein